MNETKTILELVAFSAILAVLPLMSTAVPVVHAYGNTALWQLGLSFNCNDKQLCLQPPFGIGGFWGWVEFDNDNTGDATLTGCSHLSTSIGAVTGADHLRVEITGWTYATHSIGPPVTFVLTDGTVTLAGVNTKGQPVTFTLAQLGLLGDTGWPAIPGHFSARTVFGFNAPPGMNFEIQVVQLTH